MITFKKKEEIENFPPMDIEEVRLKMKLSKNVIFELLNKFKNLKRIYVPYCYYKVTRKKILNALKKIGVEVIYSKKRGRNRKIQWEKVINLYNSGYSPTEISRMLKINRRSVYYILKNYRRDDKT